MEGDRDHGAIPRSEHNKKSSPCQEDEATTVASVLASYYKVAKDTGQFFHGESKTPPKSQTWTSENLKPGHLWGFTTQKSISSGEESQLRDVFVPELWRTETWTEPDFSLSPPCEKHIWKTLASCVGVFRHKNWTKWFLGQWIRCGFFLFEEQLRTVMSDISWKLCLVNRIRNKQVESHFC